MSESLAGKVAVVTGAGGGLGRSEAIALAAQGASVIVNDIGDAADAVVAEITSAGGRATALKGDVGSWDFGQAVVDCAVDTYGSLDIVINNAGVLRDAMIFNLTERDWDDVIRVHLKGHAALTHAASVYWRAKSKAQDGPLDGCVVNTTSEAFLFGAAGQSNYAAAKAGITALTLSTSAGLRRYGIRANAICPRARSAMTAHVFGEDSNSDRLDILSPDRVGTFVAYLASPAAAKISGQVFVVYGDFVALMAAPEVEKQFVAADGEFTIDEFESTITPYFADRSPHKTYAAYSLAALDTTGVENLTQAKKA